jgi:hypothetical protein
MRTPSSGAGLVHRLLLTLGQSAAGASKWGSGPRARLEPALESWCARILGDPSRVRCRVDIPGAAPIFVALSDLTAGTGGPSALDLIFEAPTGALEGDTPWIRRVEAYVLSKPEYAAREGALVIASDGAAAEGTVSLHDLAELGRAMRSLIAKSRPLDGRDLALPGIEAEAGWDVSEAESRVDALAADFTAAVSALVSQGLAAPHR